MLLLCRNEMFKRLSTGVICLSLVFSGCSHMLQVKNLHMYKPDFVESSLYGKKIGLTVSTNTPAEERLVTSAANGLKRNGFQVVYPYFPNGQNKNSVDYAVEVKTSSTYHGSGWNFLINWPGFLIWTPAWHGYNYRALFGFDLSITESATGRTFPPLTIPLDFVIRHAAINRTWTEISWLEWSAIAFIGGIVFTRYDNSVTPLLIDAIENKVGDYVAGKITGALVSTSLAASEPAISDIFKTEETPSQKPLFPTASPIATGVLPPTAGEREDS